MLKKLMLLLYCISLFAMIACGDEGGSTTDTDTGSTSGVNGDDTFGFTIEIITDDELDQLSEYIEVDYGVARETFITEGFNVLFNFNQSVKDFSLINTTHSEYGSVVKTGVLYEVGDLEPDKPLVITHYFSNGLMGFYFEGTDSDGGWFTFEQNSIDGGITWSRFEWSHDRELFVDDEFELDPDMPSLDEVEGMMPEIDPVTDPDEVILSIMRLMRINDMEEGEEEFEDPGMLTVDDEEDGLLANIDFDLLIESYDEMFDFNDIHVFDYNYIREARGDLVNIGDYIGDAILIQTNMPLRDFAVILIGHDTLEDDGIIFVPTDKFGMIAELLPGDAFIIKSYLGVGTVPLSGITFIDEDDVQRYYAIVQDHSGLLDPYLLIQFEDRTDELPEDWQPWWEEE